MTEVAHPKRRLSRPQRAWRAFKRLALASSALLALLALVAVVDGWRAFGKRPAGARLERMRANALFQDGVFLNPQPLHNEPLQSLQGMLERSEFSSPNAASGAATLPVESVPAERFRSPPSSGLRVTWLGHSTALIELDGARVLTDPVWGERTSPLTWLGPARWYAPPLALDDLPPLDAILISHDHYDHLDAPTIEALRDRDTTWVVPLGVAAHLEYWGVPQARIVELEWWQSTTLGGVEVTCTPARHASGRHLFDQDRTLWAGYALRGPTHRVYFSGDTGLFPAMREIGERLGPFDLTLIEVGAYHASWPDWHLGPEQALVAHQWVGGEVLLPIHWGLFDLAYHGWTEPIERTLAAADARQVRALSPRPGHSVELGPEVTDERAQERWWPAVPWRTGAQDPIRATGLD